MSQQSPPRHFSNRPLYDGNHHYGRGPQHNGTKISNTNTQSGVHIWFDRHRTQVFATIALVAIVAIVSLGLGLGLGLRDNQDTPYVGLISHLVTPSFDGYTNVHFLRA